MIVTTTPSVEGYRVTGYYGIVFGEVITGINFLRDFGAGIRNIVGGRSAAELVEALRLDVETDAGTCRLSASVGVALAPACGRDFEALYRRADRALYRAKALGKDCFVLDEG